MAESAAHPVDEVIPRVLVRQWVLSHPIPLRILFAAHPELLAPVLRTIHRVIAGFLHKQAGLKRATTNAGAVTLIQRFGSAANYARVRCSAHQRKDLERLCRTITRPAIAHERLGRDDAGNVVLQLKSPWRDGTTHIGMLPLEFMQRLAALVPRPRLHLIRFHGVLAPNARLRAAIVPGPAQNTRVPADEHAHGAPARMGWARLLERVFDLDLEHCPQCGGEFRIIAAIEEHAVIVRILTHLGLPARTPPRSPARPLAFFQAA